ncbi:MAG TPA: hypothetical protein VG708_08360 [Mycobacteriales bacterium]|nr:hypothetical protein [Mycobacteriales bacterium]
MSRELELGKALDVMVGEDSPAVLRQRLPPIAHCRAPAPDSEKVRIAVSIVMLFQ